MQNAAGLGMLGAAVATLGRVERDASGFTFRVAWAEIEDRARREVGMELDALLALAPFWLQAVLSVGTLQADTAEVLARVLDVIRAREPISQSLAFGDPAAPAFVLRMHIDRELPPGIPLAPDAPPFPDAPGIETPEAREAPSEQPTKRTRAVRGTRGQSVARAAAKKSRRG